MVQGQRDHHAGRLEREDHLLGNILREVVGESNTYKTVAAGGTVTAPADPVVENHTFGGWYTDAACTTAYDFSSAVTGNMSLYAKLTANGSGGDSDDPDFVCRTDGVEAEFTWRPDYAPEEARGKMRKLGIPEEFYIDRRR